MAMTLVSTAYRIDLKEYTEETWMPTLTEDIDILTNALAWSCSCHASLTRSKRMREQWWRWIVMGDSFVVICPSWLSHVDCGKHTVLCVHVGQCKVPVCCGQKALCVCLNAELRISCVCYVMSTWVWWGNCRVQAAWAHFYILKAE